jgi:hypothetical protein
MSTDGETDHHRSYLRVLGQYSFPCALLSALPVLTRCELLGHKPVLVHATRRKIYTVAPLLV